jgi:hypothetical protein
VSVEKLQQEANEFREKKRLVFLSALDQEHTRFKKFIVETVYDTRERSIALTRLDETFLWLKEAVNKHGIE